MACFMALQWQMKLELTSTWIPDTGPFTGDRRRDLSLCILTDGCEVFDVSDCCGPPAVTLIPKSATIVHDDEPDRKMVAY